MTEIPNKIITYTLSIIIFALTSQVTLAESKALQQAGEEYKPSYKECIKALENGVVIPRHDGPGAFVFYKNAGYLIVPAGKFVCRAFSYR